MIPSNIKKEHIEKAINEIDVNGIPSNRKSKSYYLTFAGKKYPPKYVLSLANRFANGKELNPSEFNGGQEANVFLKKLGFNVIELPLSKMVTRSKENKMKLDEVKELYKGEWIAFRAIEKKDNPRGEVLIHNKDIEKFDEELLLRERELDNVYITFAGPIVPEGYAIMF